MLYRTDVKRTFESCSKITFVPAKNQGVFALSAYFRRDRRPRRSAMRFYIFSTDRPGGRSLQGLRLFSRQTNDTLNVSRRRKQIKRRDLADYVAER